MSIKKNGILVDIPFVCKKYSGFRKYGGLYVQEHTNGQLSLAAAGLQQLDLIDTTKYYKKRRQGILPLGQYMGDAFCCFCRLLIWRRGPPLVLRFREPTKIKEDKPMAKPYRIPDFRKMYPEASEEVIAVLRTTERKMQYQEYDLKMECTVVDQESQTVTIIPSREDSFERLLEKDVQFCEESVSAEEQAIRNIEIRQLHKALSLLSDDERYLMEQLYFQERTERELAAQLNLSQNAINKRRQRVLDKLRELMKKI